MSLSSQINLNRNSNLKNPVNIAKKAKKDKMVKKKRRMMKRRKMKRQKPKRKIRSEFRAIFPKFIL